MSEEIFRMGRSKKALANLRNDLTMVFERNMDLGNRWIKVCFAIELANVTGSTICFAKGAEKPFLLCDLARKHADLRGATRQS